MIVPNADYMEETFIENDSRMYVPEERMLPLIYPADRHAVRDFVQLWSTLPLIERPNLGWKKVHLTLYNSGDTFEDALDLVGHRESEWDWGFAIC